MLDESIELIKLCQIAPNVNHKQELSLDMMILQFLYF